MKRAYTLIELMVALAIGALLVGLAVPRFTAYQQRLEFEQQARIIQECMQGAAEQAAAPIGLPSGTSKITVTLSPFAQNTSSSSCSYIADGIGAVATSSSTGAVRICSLNGSNPSLSFLKYTLPIAKHGAIDQILPRSPTIFTVADPNSFRLKQSDCDPNGLSATIVVPSTGLPVQLIVSES